MDESKRADVASKLSSAGIELINEGRKRFNYNPIEGGDTIYMQQQDYPISEIMNNKLPSISQEAAQPEEESAGSDGTVERALAFEVLKYLENKNDDN